MKKILILANSASGLYDFRNELLLKLLEEYEVHVSLPDVSDVPQLEEEGCIVHITPLDRRGMNPVKDMGLLKAYASLIKKIKPDAVLTYTIKPNIYGNLCCRWYRVPYFVNITGLGSVFENGGMVQKIVVALYRIALKNASCIFFQNETNQKVFETHQIRGKKTRLVSGSGVNLDRHRQEAYPLPEETVRFLYVGRIMKEKGMDELLEAAQRIKKVHEHVEFCIVGSYEEDYKESVKKLEKEQVIQWIPYQKEIHPYYTKAHAVLMPSYHEGMSNVILEASATGRPVLASDIPGCQEGFDDGVTGFGFEPRNAQALYETIEKFLALSYEERRSMGQAARAKMEREFDRKMVVAAYMEELQTAILK